MNSDDGTLLGDTYDFHLADDTNFFKEHADDLNESQHKIKHVCSTKNSHKAILIWDCL